MKRYVFIGLILSLIVNAEENPFSLNENLQKIDKIEKLLLSSLNDSKSKNIQVHLNSKKYLQQAVKKKRPEKKDVKILKSEEDRKYQAKIKNDIEVVRIKRITEKRQNNKNHKLKKLSTREELSNKKKELDKAYLDAIMDVNL